jgi:hypothetical protein
MKKGLMCVTGKIQLEAIENRLGWKSPIGSAGELACSLKGPKGPLRHNQGLFQTS